VGTVRVSRLGWRLPGGIELLRDVSFTVRDGERAALVGANGVGKSTVLALISGDSAPTSGTIGVDGRIGVMRQLVGVADTSRDAPQTVGEMLLSLAPPELQRAHTELNVAESAAATDPMRYAHAMAAWSDAGGYAAEVHWDECTTRAVGLSLDEVAGRPLRTLSGGEQKRLALEVLLRSDADVLLLDEPDNFLDVDAKRWLEGELQTTRKTVLYVSHDRQLLATTATKIVTIEACGAWTFGDGFAGYAAARRAHLDTLDKDRSLCDEERKRLEAIVAEMRRRAATGTSSPPG
jgi:ATPase subunit of ABC transporter with duplicated ATPase domains